MNNFNNIQELFCLDETDFEDPEDVAPEQEMEELENKIEEEFI